MPEKNKAEKGGNETKKEGGEGEENGKEEVKKGKEEGGKADAPKKTCRHYAGTGTCWFGARCKFSHEGQDKEEIKFRAALNKALRESRGEQDTTRSWVPRDDAALTEKMNKLIKEQQQLMNKVLDNTSSEMSSVRKQLEERDQALRKHVQKQNDDQDNLKRTIEGYLRTLEQDRERLKKREEELTRREKENNGPVMDLIRRMEQIVKPDAALQKANQEREGLKAEIEKLKGQVKDLEKEKEEKGRLGNELRTVKEDLEVLKKEKKELQERKGRLGNELKAQIDATGKAEREKKRMETVIEGLKKKKAGPGNGSEDELEELKKKAKEVVAEWEEGKAQRAAQAAQIRLLEADKTKLEADKTKLAEATRLKGEILRLGNESHERKKALGKEEERERLRREAVSEEEADLRQEISIEQERAKIGRKQLRYGSRHPSQSTPTTKTARKKKEEARKGVDMQAQREGRKSDAQALRQKRREEELRERRMSQVEHHEEKEEGEEKAEGSGTPGSPAPPWQVGQKVWVKWGDAKKGEELKWIKATVHSLSKTRKSISVLPVGAERESEWIKRSQWEKELMPRGEKEEMPNLGNEEDGGSGGAGAPSPQQ
eukprot:gene21128-15326_t